MTTGGWKSLQGVFCENIFNGQFDIWIDDGMNLIGPTVSHSLAVDTVRQP